MKIKGFDKNLCCRGMQYEIGKEYSTEASNITAEDLYSGKVLHYSDSLQKVHNIYDCNKDNRYCEVDVLGEEVTNGEEYGSNHIKIIREIVGEELEALKGHTNGNAGLFNSGKWNSGYHNSGNENAGYRNSGNRNSGDENSGDENSGNCNSGDENSGYQNSGCQNSGNRNSGYRNGGNWNSGDENTGYQNRGNGNSGNRNTGDRNSGDENSGNRNSGIFNSCNYSTGVFCNKEDNSIMIFNKPSGISYETFLNSKYYRALISVDFPLTEWVEYTEEEMRKDKYKEITGGYLLQNDYKEACRKWWDAMSGDNKEIIKSMPNFDAAIFKDITGITI